jgi:hypothetical protein
VYTPNLKFALNVRKWLLIGLIIGLVLGILAVLGWAIDGLFTGLSGGGDALAALFGWVGSLFSSHGHPSELKTTAVSDVGWTWGLIVVLWLLALLSSLFFDPDDGCRPRLWLWHLLSYPRRTPHLPWELTSFLDEAAKHHLLCQVGETGYMFRHRLLLDYFAPEA